MSGGLIPLSPKSQSNLLIDIRLLMYSHGDVSSPLQASVHLVQTILRHQTHSLLCHLASICDLRETTAIGLEEIIFLFRRNTIKLQRLLSHIKTRDLKAAILAKDAETGDSQSPAESSKGRRFTACEKFLSKIDEAGTFDLALEGDVADPVRQRRLTRQDLMTRTMNEDQYMKYHESRQVSLAKRLKSPKIRDWLFGDIEKQYKISASTLELIAYCMHEIIAEIVDSAIMLKIEQHSLTDPVERLNPQQHAVNPDWLTQRITLNSELSALSMISSLNSANSAPTTPQPNHNLSTLDAIRPEEIREALRRRSERTTLLHPKAGRESQMPPLNELLCL